MSWFVWSFYLLHFFLLIFVFAYLIFSQQIDSFPNVFFFFKVSLVRFWLGVVMFCVDWFGFVRFFGWSKKKRTKWVDSILVLFRFSTTFSMPLLKKHQALPVSDTRSPIVEENVFWGLLIFFSYFWLIDFLSFSFLFLSSNIIISAVFSFILDVNEFCRCCLLFVL